VQTSITTASELGSCVRQARKAQGLTQKQLSGFFTAFSREFLSDLENGKQTVELEKSLAVLNSLGLRVTVSFAENPEITPATNPTATPESIPATKPISEPTL